MPGWPGRGELKRTVHSCGWAGGGGGVSWMGGPGRARTGCAVGAAAPGRPWARPALSCGANRARSASVRATLTINQRSPSPHSDVEASAFRFGPRLGDFPPPDRCTFELASAGRVGHIDSLTAEANLHVALRLGLVRRHVHVFGQPDRAVDGFVTTPPHVDLHVIPDDDDHAHPL